MIEQTDTVGALELMSQPAFCVKDGMITQVNRAARSYLIEPNTPVAPLLGDAAEEYAQFDQGCLYLTLRLAYQQFSASVTPVNGVDVFVLDPEGDHPALRAMALAAQELRNPMSDLMAIADRLFPELERSSDERTRTQILHMNRSLYQIMRVVFNMADASRYAQQMMPRQLSQNICSILDDIFKKAASAASHSQITLRYQGLQEKIFTLVEEEKLERAVLNMISNAIKFTEQGGTIEAQLIRRENRLYLSVQDSGTGISGDIISNLHRHYQRTPTLEDARCGLGLGMSMVRACAAAHGGTVLITRPEGGGTRITMTIAIRQGRESTLRTAILRPDYAGERNHCLLELSECLPVELYSTDIL